MAEPAYTRLDVDERRRRLLPTRARLFTERAYDEVSMAAVARAAGISQSLLYHYFPGKREFFRATLAAAAAEMATVTTPDPGLAPLEQLETSLDAYLDWIERNATAYLKFVQSTGVPEVRELVEE